MQCIKCKKDSIISSKCPVCWKCVPFLDEKKENEHKILQDIYIMLAFDGLFRETRANKIVDKNSKGTKFGEIIKSKRGFSFEVESFYKDPVDLVRVVKTTHPSLGYVHDGSLDQRNVFGKEFVTPILVGDKGEEYIRLLCQRLLANNFFVNEKCGLHVHIDATKFINKVANIKTLLKFYIMFEDVISSFLPVSRRANRYCKKLSHFLCLRNIDQCYDVLDIEKMWYATSDLMEIENSKAYHYHESRYTGFNFHSLLSQGHMEIRYHSGTLNYRKMLEWANLHILIMDKIQKGGLYPAVFEDCGIYNFQEKTERFFEIIELGKESREYFLSRQERFKTTASRLKEDSLSLSTEDLKAKNNLSCVV